MSEAFPLSKFRSRPRERKPGRLRSKALLDEARESGCAACGDGEATHAHHLTVDAGLKAMKLKAPDSSTVGLCPTCHHRLHLIGERRFWREVGLEPREAVRRAHLPPLP